MTSKSNDSTSKSNDSTSDTNARTANTADDSARIGALRAGGSPLEAMTWLRDMVDASAAGLRLLAAADADQDHDGPGLRDVLTVTPSEALGGLFGRLVELKALAEGASAAVLAEAVSRGVVAASDPSSRQLGTKVTDWVTAKAAAADAPLTVGAVGTYRKVWEQSERPELAPLTSAIYAGRVSLPVGSRLGADLATLLAVIPGDVWDAAAEEMVAHAARGASASQLGNVRDALIAKHGPADAAEGEQKELHRHRLFTTPVKSATGLWVGSYAMDNDAHATLVAALDVLAAPAKSADGEMDVRTAGQRNLDAVVEMAAVVATDPTLLRHARPASLTRAQVIVTMPYGALCAGLDARGSDAGGRGELGRGETVREGLGGEQGYGLDGHGNPLTAATVRRMCCDAAIIPAVLGTDSAVLDLGRSSRLASADQIRYLRLRDRCCTFPGCDRPPSWCQVHHLLEWDADQGPTDVSNLALLCTRHHTEVHARGLIGELRDGRIRWRRRERPARKGLGAPPRAARPGVPGATRRDAGWQGGPATPLRT